MTRPKVSRLAAARLAAAALAVVLPACHVSNTPPITNTMTISSPAFGPGATIPVRFTCDGAAISPPLTWSGAPITAAAVAIVVEDPDAPRGGFTHWILTGIDARRTSLGEGERPVGVREGTAGDGQAHYVGPCPPHGKPHHYRFTVYALRRPAAPTVAAIVASASPRGRYTALFGR
ncbi:MAG: hypothetical protein QOG64_915 [Acidimicrobiaceae bacterium]|nr:hypothetical protein [Acidimicrobiaceae bacterium]